MAPIIVTHPFSVPEDSPFPVSNLPFGIFSTQDRPDARPGVAVGDYVIDLQSLCQLEQSLQLAAEAFANQTLNAFAALPRDIRSLVRKQIRKLIEEPGSSIYDEAEQPSLLFPRADVATHLPLKVEGFSDFMCALEHVQNVGRLAGAPGVPPNFFNLPIAYNGRASSVVVSGTEINRPWGIFPSQPGSPPVFAPSKRLDFEMELGIFISGQIPFGHTVTAENAKDHVFGFVLLNDWSARDIQFYEMLPLGPFNGKAFGTSISPWVVTLDALEEAGAVVKIEPAGLEGGKESTVSLYKTNDDVSIQVSTYCLMTGGTGGSRAHLGTSNSSHMHWSPFQMVAHHSTAGCGLSAGDLLGSGTISSSEEQAKAAGNTELGGKRLGCLQELTIGGKSPIPLDDGSELVWIQDGDEVIMEGWAGQGNSRIGFGEVRGTIIPARPLSS